MNRKILWLYALLLVIFISCRSMSDNSLGDFERATLPGMIYDADNSPCSKVHVKVQSINDRDNPSKITSQEVLSDINGRFALPDLEKGRYLLTAVKEGYEVLQTEVYYSSRMDVLYLKMFSQQQILSMASEALDDRRYSRAETYLLRSEKIHSGHPSHLFLKAIYSYKKKEYDQAIDSLSLIVDQGYNFPYVYLFLADIYQDQNVQMPEEALRNLRIYSEMIDDPQIHERISDLEQLMEIIK